MKEFVFTLFMITAVVFTSAQQVISAGGQTNTAGNIELSWTLGEPVIETVSEGTTVLTQGFHQSKLTVTAIDALSLTEMELKVYPNPTSDFVVVHINNAEVTARFALFDFSGKMLSQKPITATDTRLDMLQYASGTYVLKLFDEEEHPIQSFKIIKR